MSNVSPCVLCVAAGSALAGAAVTYLLLKGGCCSKADPTESRDIYETDKSALQYMEFHFTPSSVLAKPHLSAAVTKLSDAYDFPIKIAQLFNDFKPASTARALDLGCAVGASAFEMSTQFDEVVGIDLSSAFIRFANKLKAEKSVSFPAADQGELEVSRSAKLKDHWKPERVSFLVGDACNVDPALGTFDAVLLANLVDRVPEPEKMLSEQLPRIVNAGGIVIILTPFTWWEAATHKEKWLGARVAGQRSEDALKGIMAKKFDLLTERGQPFLIRDHHRKFQLSVSYCTVWRRRKD